VLNTYYEKNSIEHTYEVFRAHGFSPDWVISAVQDKNVRMAELPPFLRTLLVTDGTVTKALEAYYWESIAVDGVAQQVMSAEREINWLNVSVGDEVLARRVNLLGKNTGTTYARAFSVIRHSMIPEPLRGRLLAGTLGIGELIRDSGIETYRELLEIGLADTVGGLDGQAQSSEEHIYRTYRIVLRQQPAIMVTEYFPVSVFSA
jgi:chorismate-pyruvate lyase